MEGHRRGFEAIKAVAEEFIDNGVQYVSAYIFSTENWNRSEKEISYLMDLAYERVTKDLDEINEKNIRLRVLGRREKVSDKLLKAIDTAVETTKNNTKGTLALCFNYGGHQEIVDAVNVLLAEGKQQIDEDDIARHLYAPDIPPIDMMVRTSGEQRISNFMLWRINYSEILFIKKHFPAMKREDAHKILEEYARRHRRFGQ